MWDFCLVIFQAGEVLDSYTHTQPPNTHVCVCVRACMRVWQRETETEDSG